MSSINFPQTVAQYEDEGGDTEWANINDVKAQDGVFAFNELSGGSKSYILQATNYGFTIPTTATIDGIEVIMLRKDALDMDAILDISARLLRNNNPVGDNYRNLDYWGSDPPPSPPFIPGRNTIQYGSSSDKWGTTWTPAQINDASFGFEIYVNSETESGKAEIDYIKIKVYYTEAAGVSTSCVMQTNKFCGPI